MACAAADTALLVCRCGEWHWRAGRAEAAVSQSWPNPLAEVFRPREGGATDGQRPSPGWHRKSPRKWSAQEPCCERMEYGVSKFFGPVPWPPWHEVAAEGRSATVAHATRHGNLAGCAAGVVENASLIAPKAKPRRLQSSLHVQATADESVRRSAPRPRLTAASFKPFGQPSYFAEIGKVTDESCDVSELREVAVLDDAIEGAVVLEQGALSDKRDPALVVPVRGCLLYTSPSPRD